MRWILQFWTVPIIYKCMSYCNYGPLFCCIVLDCCHFNGRSLGALIHLTQLSSLVLYSDSVTALHCLVTSLLLPATGELRGTDGVIPAQSFGGLYRAHHVRQSSHSSLCVFLCNSLVRARAVYGRGSKCKLKSQERASVYG